MPNSNGLRFEGFQRNPSAGASSEVTLEQLAKTLEEVAATQMELMKKMDQQRADLLLIHSETKSNYVAIDAWLREIFSKVSI